MRELEDRMTRRMAESVESLGEIITEYANKYQLIQDKLKALEPTKPGKGIRVSAAKASNQPSTLKKSSFQLTGQKKAKTDAHSKLLSSKGSKVATARSNVAKVNKNVINQ